MCEYSDLSVERGGLPLTAPAAEAIRSHSRLYSSLCFGSGKKEKGLEVSPSLSNLSAIANRHPRMNPRKFIGFGLKPGKIAPRLVAPR
jgi:hypothetical protein